jgi:hypothetical protein
MEVNDTNTVPTKRMTRATETTRLAPPIMPLCFFGCVPTHACLVCLSNGAVGQNRFY